MLTSRLLSTSVPSKSIRGHVGLQMFGSQTPSILAAVGVFTQDCNVVSS